MKTIGLLGGMSWESTVTYYQLINRGVQRRLGKLHSAPLLLHSVDFEAIAAMQRAGEWQRAGQTLAHSARALRQAGADCILIGTNTMHRVADAVQTEIDIPLLHIVDATAAALRRAGVARAGLIGTLYTMETGGFFERRMARHGIELIMPDATRQQQVQEAIFNGLCKGIVTDDIRALFAQTIEALGLAGAQGTILGCTEIQMAVDVDGPGMPLFDTTRLHAQAALDFAFDGVMPPCAD